MLLDMNIHSVAANPSIGLISLSAYRSNFSNSLKSLYLIFFFMHVLSQYYRRNLGLDGLYDYVKNIMIRNFYIGGRVGKGLIIIIL